MISRKEYIGCKFVHDLGVQLKHWTFLHWPSSDYQLSVVDFTAVFNVVQRKVMVRMFSTVPDPNLFVSIDKDKMVQHVSQCEELKKITNCSISPHFAKAN